MILEYILNWIFDRVAFGSSEIIAVQDSTSDVSDEHFNAGAILLY